jgi:ADP-ribose pyrophosphatase YjhB (NUDIX family)
MLIYSSIFILYVNLQSKHIQRYIYYLIFTKSVLRVITKCIMNRYCGTRPIVKKSSFGVSLWRFNVKKTRWETLLVKKRCTYAFTTFVFGGWNYRDDDRLLYLFSRMTYYEKSIIMSFNFNLIWFHQWNKDPDQEFKNSTFEVYQNDSYSPKRKFKSSRYTDLTFFAMKKTKFADAFCGSSKAKDKLKKLIDLSKSADCIWDIPKGRKSNTTDEPSLSCAMRELEEETKIKDYHIIKDIKPFSDSFIDENVRYTSIYYIGYTSNQNLNFNLQYSDMHQVAEVSQIKWVTLEEINFLENSDQLLKMLIPIKKLVKKRCKKYNVTH